MRVSSRSKPLLLLLVFLLAVPLLLLLGLNLLLQTTPIKERLRSTLSITLGMPISFSSLSATLCGDIKVVGISGGAVGNSVSFKGDSIFISPSYLRLLHGEILINDLRIIHPVLHSSLTQVAMPPGPSSLPVLETPQASVTPSSSLQQPSLQPSQTTSTSAVALPTQAQIILRQIPRLAVTDAEVTLLNTQNLPIATIEGMSLLGSLTSTGTWQGTLKAHQVIVGNSLILHDLDSPITLSSGISKLSLEGLTATLGGGKLAGEFTLALPPSALQYQTHLTLTGAKLNQFFLDASLGNLASEGAITGDLQLSGVAGSAETMEGTGNLLCTDAVIQPADFLRQIGEILQIQELQMLHLAEGKAAFNIHQGETQITQLYLRSQNLILTAQGPMKPNGDLDLQARLLFNEKLTGRLHGLIGSQLSPAPEAGYSQVSFRVYGPAKSPKTDLLERLTGIHIGGDLGGLLQGLFGRPANH